MASAWCLRRSVLPASLPTIKLKNRTGITFGLSPTNSTRLDHLLTQPFQFSPLMRQMGKAEGVLCRFVATVPG